MPGDHSRLKRLRRWRPKITSDDEEAEPAAVSTPAPVDPNPAAHIIDSDSDDDRPIESLRRPKKRKKKKQRATKSAAMDISSVACISSGVTLRNYKRAVLVEGDTYPIKDLLKDASGSWNPSLQAWVFPQDHRQALQVLLAQTGTTGIAAERDKAAAAAATARRKKKAAHLVKSSSKGCAAEEGHAADGNQCHDDQDEGECEAGPVLSVIEVAQMKLSGARERGEIIEID